jgi:GAF domain-containing protein
LAGQIGVERKVIHIPDLAALGDIFLRQELLKKEEFVEYFGVPLIAKGQVVGVLEIFNRSPLDPDQEWLDFLEALGGQAAIAIDSATLFKNLQKSNLNSSRLIHSGGLVKGFGSQGIRRPKATAGG